MNKIRRWLTPPTFEDEQKSRIALMLHIILLTVLAATFLVMIVSWLGDHILTPPLMAIGMGLTMAAIWFMRRGHLTWAGLIFLLSFTAFLTLLMHAGDGVPCVVDARIFRVVFNEAFYNPPHLQFLE